MKYLKHAANSPALPRTFLLFIALTAGRAVEAEIVVPIRALASSNVGSGGEEPRWHVDTLVLGAKHFDLANGTNTPYGLMGMAGCSTDRPGATTGLSAFPGHEWYRAEPAEHPKPQGMWLSASGDNEEAWIEFELPDVTSLDQIWIWNWNDGPEVGRRVRPEYFEQFLAAPHGMKAGTTMLTPSGAPAVPAATGFGLPMCFLPCGEG